MSGKAQKSTARHVPEIDGLRALAVVAVIINHFDKKLLPSGYLGVDVFFVISGFVITASLVNRKEESLRTFLAGFYNRRIKRLAPALFLCFIVTIFLISFFSPNPSNYIKTGVLSLVGFSNISLYFNAIDYWGESARLNPFTHTWSLGVEEQFYFLFPFLVWFAIFRRRGQNGPKRLLGIVSVLSLVSLPAFVYFNGTDQSAAYYLMPFRFWEIGAGCILFLLKRNLVKVGSIPPLFPLLALLAALFMPLEQATTATILVVFLTVLVIASIASGAVLTVLSNRAVVFIGVISYSLYLWHWVVVAISRWTIGIHWWSIPFQLAVIFLLAAGSYYFVELPLRYKVWFPTRRRTALLAGSASTMATLVAFFFIIPSSSALYLGRAKSVQPIPVASSQNILCGGVKKTIQTIGNSHANHILPMLRVIAEECNLVLTYQSHPDYIVIPDGSGRHMEKMPEVLDNLDSGDILILSSRNRYLYNIPYLNASGDKWVDHSEEKKQKGFGLGTWLSELDSLLDATAAKGINVVLFLPNVEFDVPVPKYDAVCQEEWFRVQSQECNPSVKKEFLDQRFPPQFYQEVQMRASANENFFIYDPLPVYCPDNECPRVIDGVNAFADTNHLTQSGAKLMVAGFNTFLTEHHLLE